MYVCPQILATANRRQSGVAYLQIAYRHNACVSNIFPSALHCACVANMSLPYDLSHAVKIYRRYWLMKTSSASQKNYRLVQSHTRRLFKFNVTVFHVHCDTFATIHFYAYTFICRSFFILRVVGAPTTGSEGTICFLVVHQAVCLPISDVCVT